MVLRGVVKAVKDLESAVKNTNTEQSWNKSPTPAQPFCLRYMDARGYTYELYPQLKTKHAQSFLLKQWPATDDALADQKKGKS